MTPDERRLAAWYEAAVIRDNQLTLIELLWQQIGQREAARGDLS